MRPTKTLLGGEARKAIHAGVNAVYEPVKRTLGPEGKNALLYKTANRPGGRITNDGVTVGGTQEPKNQFTRLAAQAFQETCRKTNEKVGDGTTTTTVIGGTLYNDIYKILLGNDSLYTSKNKKNTSVVTIKKEIKETAEKVKEQLTKSAKKIKTKDDLYNIALISTENEELAKIITELAWKVGEDGFIDVTEGYKGIIETDIITGMRFHAKVAGKVFVNKREKFEMVATNTPVMISNLDIDNPNLLASVLNPILQKYNKVVVMANSFTPQVLESMAKAMFEIDVNGNFIKTGLELYPVKIPSLTLEQCEDLAIFFDANLIDKHKGHRLENAKKQDFGFVEKLIVKDSEAKEDAMAIGGDGTKLVSAKDEEKSGFSENEEKSIKTKTAVEERIKVLKEQLKETRHEQFKKLLERRIASMASAVGTIKVGATTDAENYYRKLKVEDGVYACKAALRGGYVKGAGFALKEIADKLPDTNLLKNALLTPYELIKESLGGEINLTDNIIDPAEAMYYAVEHAVQVVAELITVDVITIELEDPLLEEGNYAVARQIGKLVELDRIHKGIKKENLEEQERDRYGGLSEDDYLYLNSDETKF